MKQWPQTPEASQLQGSLGYEGALPQHRDNGDLQCSKRQSRAMKLEDLWIMEEAEEAAQCFSQDQLAGSLHCPPLQHNAVRHPGGLQRTRYHVL